MKSNVDPDLCIGCGLCPSVCPEVYSLGDDGLAHAIEEEIPQDQLKDAEDARDGCPVSAIDLFE